MRSQRARPGRPPEGPLFFCPGKYPTLRDISKSRVGETVAQKTAACRRDLRRNHEGMKRKGPTLKRSDATNGRAIMKNLDNGPVEAEDNIQRDPLES
jgi:hypothetical protein